MSCGAISIGSRHTCLTKCCTCWTFGSESDGVLILGCRGQILWSQELSNQSTISILLCWVICSAEFAKLQRIDLSACVLQVEWAVGDGGRVCEGPPLVISGTALDECTFVRILHSWDIVEAYHLSFAASAFAKVMQLE